MVIHAHHSVNPIAGDTKRVININADVACQLDDSVIEIEYIPLRSLIQVIRSEKFKLTPTVSKKFYVLNISHLGLLNDIWLFLYLSIIFFLFRPSHYIEEWELPKFIKTIVRLFGKKTEVILDIHGASPEEYEYINGRSSKRWVKLERKSVYDADRIICQSDEMQRHLLRKYTLNEDNILVFRCGVDTDIFKYSDNDRKSIRKELSINEDELLFVYSGGMHKWQKVGETLMFFNKYHTYNPKSKMLVLTKEVEKLNSILHECELEDLKGSMVIKSLPFVEVPKYLCASDFAFLLRDNVIMNAVASPTKLGEYMACGLPVISTEVANKWVTREGLEYIIDYNSTNLSSLEDYHNRIPRTSIINYAKNSLSILIDRENAKRFFIS